jgi:hypothetical protein
VSAPNQLTLYNGALIICGGRILTALSDETKGRRLLDQAWANFPDAALEQGQWYFAMRSQRITFDPSITPDWGFRRVFEVPTDHVRTVAVCQDEDFKVPLVAVKEEAGFWYAHLDTIYVRFVSDDPTFGGDFSLWPSSFTEFVKADLASRIVWDLTSDKQKADQVDKRCARALAKAKGLAAMADSTQFPAEGSWVRSRRGDRRGWPDGGNRGQLIG